MFLTKRTNTQLQALSDLELLDLYRKKRAAIYMNELYGRYVHLVFGACLKYLHDKAASKDMTMEIFERLLAKPPGPEVKRFNTWLYVMIRNECVSASRKQRTEDKRLEDWKNTVERDEYPVANEAVHQLYQVEEAEEIPKESIHQAIKQLSKEQMQCIQLFFFDQKSYKEIAGLTKFTVQQVKSYLQNGKRNLRHILSRQEGSAD